MTVHSSMNPLISYDGSLDLPPAWLRSGIHRRQVTVARDGDIFGAAVNLAVRLQTSADPDQIIVSSKVADSLGSDDHQSRAEGFAELRNVPEPFERFRILGTGGW